MLKVRKKQHRTTDYSNIHKATTYYNN